ncbi:MAG TPA: hypothetical protein VEA99_20440, partial [Gemmatimonadaceae bacterium]|nr:hypothetical protein [Gemmatimonadaceae bacterium]
GRAGGGGGGGGGFGGAFAGLEGGDLETAQELLRAIRGPGAGGFGGFRQPPLVNTGDYLVTLDVDGQKLRQPLRVERLASANGLFITSELEEDEEEREGREP